jgi:hypothetical protein
MKKALLLLILSASVYARPYKLQCRKGVWECQEAHCVTIVFKNKLEERVEVSGQIKAKLTGAAKVVSDGQFEFNESIGFDPVETSCFVPTGSFRKNVRSASLTLKSNGKQCGHFLPRGVGGKNRFEVVLSEAGCVVQNG